MLRTALEDFLRTRDRGCDGLKETSAGGPLFFVVAAATAAVMAVGFTIATVTDRVLH